METRNDRFANMATVLRNVPVLVPLDALMAIGEKNMIRRFTAWITGKQYVSYCKACGWHSGPNKLQQHHALARARLHSGSAGCRIIAVHTEKII